MSDVVTGEAVVVEVRVAQLPSRAAALLIDIAVQFTTLLGAYFLVGALAFVSDPALTRLVYIALTVLVLVGYPVAFETLSRGRSLGKLALGLRVVSDDGGPERFRQALFRALAGSLEIWALSGAPALISSLVSERSKRVGDIFAGTLVISERAPRGYGPPLDMPPQLAAWAATLELSRLPEQVAATARQYLTRWHDLSPAVRHQMGVRIATEMSAFVSPPPPPDVPPFAYLTAVLAERRRRDRERLARRTGSGHHTPQTGPGHPAGQWPDDPAGRWPGGSAGQPVPARIPLPPPAAPPTSSPPPPPPGAGLTGRAPDPTPGGFVPPA
ncbi:putative RDD family membrane protein YckC [Streptosporangium becharense]|uniref:Putative RDD family membrane protein YckC n=1 Tax=Streptosporangium becharense TaxID=1816182 RepID=A0A7W9IFU4_9ACTN|nr:RDD family protein [Streptosporangium becharense]MBB2909720.1 putative RDD family membrane protein YckC [Streptosporangium becharense]MBB5819324.1 putative RDD family membrane protein YckC [Streptosporangium becharense]